MFSLSRAFLKPSILPLPSSRTFITAHTLLNASTPAPAASSVAADDVRAKLKEALKAAMKGKDKAASGCIKSALADVIYHEKASKNPNDLAENDTVIEVIRKSIEKRAEAVHSYPSDHPNHTSLQSEIQLLSSFLPTVLSQDSITQKLQSIIDSMSEDGKKDKAATGKVLSEFWKEVKKGEVGDKKSVGKLVGDLLRR